MPQADINKEETYDERKLREQLEKESQPIWLTNMFVRRPCLLLIVSFILLAYMSRVSFKNGYFDLADSEGRDFLVWSDPKVKVDDMRNLAREYITDNEDVVIVDGEEEDTPIRSKLKGQWGMIYIFQNLKNKEYGLLLKENLLKMERVERLVNTSAEWQDYCLA